ncbi:MAG: hypothetical protein HQ483_08030 [Rhodospirillales bacterium]|nr:hypothetical protein [Rhodospirillales bacterium]
MAHGFMIIRSRVSASLILVGLLTGCQTAPRDAAPVSQVPTPVTEPATTRTEVVRPVGVHSTLKEATDNVVCIGAISDSIEDAPEWSSEKTFKMSVAEAKKRNLTPEDCVVILSEVGSTRIARALTARGPDNRDGSPSLDEMIEKHDPSNSMWRDRPWGHGGSKPSAADSDTPTDRRNSDSHTFKAALDFVKKSGLNANFPVLIMQVVTETELYKKLKTRTSETALLKAMADETRSVVEKHGDQWDVILAGVYADIFTTAELQSLLRDRTMSPHYWDMLARQNKIGKKVYENSVDLLTTASIDVLTKLLSQFSNSRTS